MSDLSSKLSSLASSASVSSSSLTDLDRELLALLKRLEPVLKMASKRGGFASLLNYLTKAGTSPSKPITSKKTDVPVWVQPPMEIDITNLSQAQVDQAIRPENVESAGSRSSKVFFPKP